MHVLILGTRGVPARHGGFETFAEDLSLYLKARNHSVTVYCQVDSEAQAGEDVWNGVRRVMIPAGKGALGTITFDWEATWRSCREDGVILTLGYNTGIFNFLYRFRQLPNVMNMDGLEWKRRKWTPMQRAWLWLNERAGARAATHLVADHPEIGKHLLRHTRAPKISVIPYGAYAVHSAPVAPIRKYGLNPKDYYLVIARPELENSILEIVQAFSRMPIGRKLVVLGTYDPKHNEYHRQVVEAAGQNVAFLGAIYDHKTVQALRFHSKAYVHGHTVGGTNPSLVESLAAGNAVIAHDNVFNRWVAGPSAKYFKSAEDLLSIVNGIESQPSQLLPMEAGSRSRHRQLFKQDNVLATYEDLLLRAAQSSGNVREVRKRGKFDVRPIRSGTEG